MNGRLSKIILSALLSSFALHLFQLPAGATLIIPRTIAEAVSTAQVIFVGRVTQVRPERAGRYNSIVTRVTFDAVTVVKGAIRPDRTTLLLRGGRLGNEEIGVDGQPQFSVGSEYVVFCTTDDFGSDANRFVPTLGMSEGVFRVGTLGADPAKVVFEPGGLPVVGIEGGRLIVVGAPTPDAEPGQGMTPSIVSQDRTTRVDPGERERASTPRPVRPVGESTRGKAVPTSDSKPPKPAQRPGVRVEQAPTHKVVPTIPTGPTVLVLDSTNDPGSRMPLAQFLEALREMVR